MDEHDPAAFWLLDEAIDDDRRSVDENLTYCEYVDGAKLFEELKTNRILDVLHRARTVVVEESRKKRQHFQQQDNALDTKRRKSYPSPALESQHVQNHSNHNPSTSTTNKNANHTSNSSSNSSRQDTGTITEHGINHLQNRAQHTTDTNSNTNNIITSSQPPLLPRQSRQDPRTFLPYYQKHSKLNHQHQ
ncbi:hypothetical protein BDF20DRAFT_850838 [Mycotypha africana]|uniref:uncharacterized protein n=1 Tax=Mycotypha africana TaxID=64632 RepID=UPI002301E08D|nr:uncharacterized protein BDF20DRAFT_850838 [Mycotypha africana]KAI8987547.1 hypothetical protein BDF20DRAFT_850838 [Mycotypha africana]